MSSRGTMILRFSSEQHRTDSCSAPAQTVLKCTSYLAHQCESLTFDREAAGALGLLSPVIGQADAEVSLVSLLGISDPQGEDVVSLNHQVLAALEHCLCVLQPLGLRSVCVHLTVQDNFLALFGFRVLQWCDDLQFFYGKKCIRRRDEGA